MAFFTAISQSSFVTLDHADGPGGHVAFIVNSVSYPINALIFNLRPDTSLIELDQVYTNALNPVVASVRKRKFYIDARTGLPFTSEIRLKEFFDSFALNTLGGGLRMKIGAPVDGSVHNLPLKVDGGGLLAQYGTIPWVPIGDSVTGYVRHRALADSIDSIKVLIANLGTTDGTEIIDTAHVLRSHTDS